MQAVPSVTRRLFFAFLALAVSAGVVQAQKPAAKTGKAAPHAAATAKTPPAAPTAPKSTVPHFLNDVIPVLTKAGCNMGSCHGAAAGKGGFKLSLFGYDPDADYESITRGAGARRIARSQPDNSLLLRKPTFGVFHKGGQRFSVDSPEYRLLRDWIVAGLPGPDPNDPHVIAVEVTPAVKTLARGQTQRYVVHARYSDGTVRDTTRQTLFNASDESVATVTPDGEAKAVGFGEGAVVVRYQGLVTTARVISPFATPRTTKANAATTTSGRIDALVTQKLDALGLDASGRCTDADFQRRASLDVIGVLPTSEEARAFLMDRSPNKREKLVDALLNRPEYTDFWTLKWGDILRCSRNILTDKGMYAYNRWIRQSVADNKPWNQFAREMLLAEGSAYSDGPANYYRASTGPQELAETTSQVFLGVRIQCARCHNHPYEKWTQNQYYQMAAFFSRVRAKKGDRANETVVYLTDSGEVRHPKSQKEMAPTALDAAPLPASYTGDRREALADWMTSAQNPFFTHNLVNRLWKHFLGRGFVEPVDDLRVTNPPSNPALFDFLSEDFARNGYDVKRLMRSILLSQTYQRTVEPKGNNARDSKYYAHYPFKRLEAEQLLDALASATGVPEKFDGFPLGTRATQLPDSAVPSYFLDLFGRPGRVSSCQCERADEPNLGQVLHMMNSAGVNTRLADKSGRVAILLASKATDNQVVEDLYLAAFARYPTLDESCKGILLLAGAKDRQKAAEDLAWALLNSNEFVFNH